MKLQYLIVLIFIILIYWSCNTATHIKGEYTNAFVSGIAGEEFKFNKGHDTFEYFSITEGGINSYSFGTWKKINQSIYLNGLNSKNLSLIDVNSNSENLLKGNRNKIIVQFNYDTLYSFIRLEVLINQNYKTIIKDDTTIFYDKQIKTIQLKSFLFYEGFMMRAIPKLDTLYSPLIEYNNLNQPKEIVLKLKVFQRDFYRVKFEDTLAIKNIRTLVWGKREFRKIKNKP